MSSNANPDAKRKILRAAERLFAQQGYDGTSVDQVAALAQVNKALIYYYYKNKQALLNALFEELSKEVLFLFDTTLRDFDATRSDEFYRGMVSMVIEYMETKKNVIRVILMESLKADAPAPMIFCFIENLINNLVGKMAKRGITLDHDYQQTLLEEFFTGTLPMAAFIVYHDQWKKYFRIPETDLKQRFIEMFMDIHVHHGHQRQMSIKGKRK
jgi:AcrR family transcriptional regulator